MTPTMPRSDCSQQVQPDHDAEFIDSEVERLKQESTSATSTMPIREAVDDFLAHADPKFFDIFELRVRNLLKRNPAHHKRQLSIFDRTLINITEYGTNLNNPAAVHYYLLMYYSLDLGFPDPDYDLIDREVATFYDYIERGLEENDIDGNTAEVNDSSSTRINNEPMRPEPRPVHAHGQRLLGAYEEACKEYLVVADARNDATLRTAKFLRDTAENLMVYVDEIEIDNEKRYEIQAMVETAKGVVQDLNGGKTRKFDHNRRNEPRVQRRASRVEYKPITRDQDFQPSHRPTLSPRNHPGCHTEEYVARNYRRSRSPVVERTYYRHARQPSGQKVYPILTECELLPEDHDIQTDPAKAYQANGSSYQQHDHYGRIQGGSDRGGIFPAISDRGRPYHVTPTYRDVTAAAYPVNSFEDHRYQPIQDLSDNPRRPPRKDRRPKGRGHSGIPYGYKPERMVDSYKPSQY